MLAKGLVKIVNDYGRDFSDWEYSREFEEFRGVKTPFQLVICCDKWVGNFERELIGYAFGVLDGVQMRGDFAFEERLRFAKEVFGRDTVIDPEEEEFELLDKYLYETFQSADDWEQITFYSVETCRNNSESMIIIQFAETPPIKWTSIFIPRIKKFFEEYASTTAKFASITEMYFEDVKKKSKNYFIEHK